MNGQRRIIDASNSQWIEYGRRSLPPPVHRPIPMNQPPMQPTFVHPVTTVIKPAVQVKEEEPPIDESLRGFKITKTGKIDDLYNTNKHRIKIIPE